MPAAVPGAAGWGGLPALPYSGRVVRAAAHALDSGLALAWQGVEVVGSPELDAGGFHNGSTSSPSGIPWLPANVAGHLRLCIRVLASPIVIARVLTPSRSTVLLLRLKVPSVVPLPLVTPLLIEVIAPLLHLSFYVDRSVV